MSSPALTISEVSKTHNSVTLSLEITSVGRAPGTTTTLQSLQEIIDGTAGHSAVIGANQPITIQYTISGLEASTDYSLAIRLRDTDGDAGDSNTLNITTDAAPVEVVPTVNLSFVSKTHNSITCKITVPTGGHGGAILNGARLFANTSGADTGPINIGISDLPYNVNLTVSGLAPTGTYTMRAEVDNADGETGHSGQFPVTTNAAPSTEASDMLTLPAANHSVPGSGVVQGHSRWLFSGDTGPLIDSDLTEQANTRLVAVVLPSSSSAGAQADTVTINLTGGNEEFIADVENSGSFLFSAPGVSPDLVIRIDGADMADPYVWDPANLSAIEAWVDAFQGLATTPAATMTISYSTFPTGIHYAPDASNLNQATGIHYAPDANTLNEVTAMYYAPDANTLNQVM